MSVLTVLMAQLAVYVGLHCQGEGMLTAPRGGSGICPDGDPYWPMQC